MKVLFWPGFSQQDKARAKFRMDTDAGVRLYSYLAKELDADLAVPPAEQRIGSVPYTCNERPLPYLVALDNFERRFQWEPALLKAVADTYDVVALQQLTYAVPLRALNPKLTILQECGLLPGEGVPGSEELIRMSWKATDLVHCNSRFIAHRVKPIAKTSVWSFAYDRDCVKPRGPQIVDVLFNARASATNYSNHDAFIRAFAGNSLTVRMTDPTSYLRATGALPTAWLSDQPLSVDRYYALLASSKVVVSLVENGYGGYAFIEAVASGCVPVALRTPAYEDVLTSEWPYYVEAPKWDAVRAAAHRALDNGWDGVHPVVRDAVTRNVSEQSYQHQLGRAKFDIADAWGRRQRK